MTEAVQLINAILALMPYALQLMLVAEQTFGPGKGAEKKADVVPKLAAMVPAEAGPVVPVLVDNAAALMNHMGMLPKQKAKAAKSS